MNPVVDCVGREIKVGCSVIYPVRRGSWMGLRRMRVQQVSAGAISGHAPDGRHTRVKRLDTAVVIVPLGCNYEESDA